jgi:hypothetical protein
MPRPLREPPPQQQEDEDQQQQQPPAVVTLKVLLFNVQQLPRVVAPEPERRAAAAASLIASSGADVVCLNECFLRADACLSAVRQSHPHRAELGGRAGWFTPLGSGLRVASRLPLLSGGAAPFFFRGARGADRFASKGVLHVRADLTPLLSAPPRPLDGRRQPPSLDLFLTHMQAGSSPAEQQSRRRQVQDAGAFMRSQSAGRPFLLCGDLNISPCAAPSVHCRTREDAEARAAAFEELCRAAGMSDASDCGLPPYELCRFCTGGGGRLRVLGVTNLGRRWQGEVASDTDALLARVEVVL